MLAALAILALATLGAGLAVHVLERRAVRTLEPVTRDVREIQDAQIRAWVARQERAERDSRRVA